MSPIPRPRSSLTTLLVIAFVIAALYFAQEVLIPLALAMLLSFVLSPIVTRLERWRVPRVGAVVGVVFLALCLVLGLGWVMKNQFVDVADKLGDYRDEIAAKFRHLRSTTGSLNRAIENLENTSRAVAPPASRPATQPATAAAPPPQRPAPAVQVGNGVATPENPLPVRNYPDTSPLESLFDYVGQWLHPMALTGLVIVFIIFMLLFREDLRDRIIRLAGPERLNLTTQAVDDSARRIARYLLAQSCVNLVYGSLVALFLWMIGRFLGHGEGAFPNILLWGLICGLCRFIPYVGPWIGASLPLAISLAFFKSNAVFFATAAMFVCLEVVVSQFAEPYIYGSSTGMSTMAILVAAIFWTTLWGPIGLLLSTPLTVIVVVLGKYVPQLAFISILLGDEPVLEPHLRMYQRLLALDQEEAIDVARQHLQEHGSLEALYDEVLLPALAKAQRDLHHGKLDAHHLKFIHDSLRDIIEELDAPSPEKVAELTRKDKEQEDQSHGGGPQVGPESGNGAAGPRAMLPLDRYISVLILPARDTADEVAGLMLSRLLVARGYTVTNASGESLASELTAMIDQHHPEITVISALPPASVSRARYLCKRLAEKHEKLPLVVGLWRLAGDLQHARDRLTCGPTVPVVTTLAGAQEQLDQLAQPLLSPTA